jgi:8-oxo-dGTP diphosphatase
VTVLVVRHAKAGSRENWAGPDRERPLTKRGWAQAEALAQLLPPLVSRPIGRILSSPYVRCRQTVEPLAAALGLAVEDEAALEEGRSLRSTLALLGRAGPEPVVLCSHGDVIGDLASWLAEEALTRGELGLAKGSIWVLERDGRGEITDARYVGPP